jgi:hypothetical protein
MVEEFFPMVEVLVSASRRVNLTMLCSHFANRNYCSYTQYINSSFSKIAKITKFNIGLMGKLPCFQIVVLPTNLH